MVVGGCAEVGSELRESMSRIHTRCNAHREQLENAMSAGASRFEMSFTPAVKLGAVVASIDRRHHDVLQISTDTFIDLEQAPASIGATTTCCRSAPTPSSTLSTPSPSVTPSRPTTIS